MEREREEREDRFWTLSALMCYLSLPDYVTELTSLTAHCERDKGVCRKLL